MRWTTLFLLLIFFVTLQSAVVTHLAVFGARPDWLLILVVFVALHAAPRDAVIAGWSIGACADLMSIERFGVMALGYGLTALAIVGIRDMLFRHRWTTQTVVTFLSSILLTTAWTAYRTTLYRFDGSLAFDAGWGIVASSLYTALWAPLIFGGLQRCGPWLGFKMPRNRHIGAQRVGLRHV